MKTNINNRFEVKFKQIKAIYREHVSVQVCVCDWVSSGTPTTVKGVSADRSIFTVMEPLCCPRAER